MNNSKKGFTLIELLVVIAIIGILATVVLASLGSARSRANDAKVQSQLKSIQNQGFLIQVPPCGDPRIQQMMTAASIQPINCQNGSETAWAIKQQLSSGQWYCVDATGFSGLKSLEPDISYPSFDCQ